jgi:hypothetical protein
MAAFPKVETRATKGPESFHPGAVANSDSLMLVHVN